MSKVKVKLLKPLDGIPEGAETEFDKADIPALKTMKAVEVLSDTDDKAKTKPANKSIKPTENKGE